jgi:hypothetical protein
MAPKQPGGKVLYMLSPHPISDIPHGAVADENQVEFINGTKDCCKERFQEIVDDEYGDRSQFEDGITDGNYVGYIYEIRQVAQVSTTHKVVMEDDDGS